MELTESMLSSASFKELCRLMEGKDKKTKKFVQKILLAAMLCIPGVLGWESVVLVQGFAFLDKSGLLEKGTEKVVGFFGKKKKTSGRENAKIALVLMVFSAYFDALQTILPKEYKAIIREIQAKGSITRRALRKKAQAPCDKGLLETSFMLPGDMGPRNFEELQAFYSLMSQRFIDFLNRLSLEGLDRARLYGALGSTLPKKAVEEYKNQFEALSVENRDFLIHNLYAMGEVSQREHRQIAEQTHQEHEELKAMLRGAQGSSEAVYSLRKNITDLPTFVEGSRDRELDAYTRALEKGETVFIWGLGGMGKTEAAMQLAKRLKDRWAFYLTPYRGTMRKTVLGLELYDGQQRRPEHDLRGADLEEAAYQKRLAILEQQYRDAVLIIDNFDADGKTLEDLLEESACRELLNLGIRLVFTTRCTAGRDEWEIRPLSDEQLLLLMRRNMKSCAPTDSQLLALIREVKGHTLTVDLMAKTLEESWGQVTPEAMLKALKNRTLSQQDYPEVATEQNRTRKQKQIYAHLKALFDVSAMDGDSKAVLGCATVLPEGGMDRLLFYNSLTEKQRPALKRLTKRGWLTESGGLLSVHPLIRQVCRGELKPTEESCGGFLKALWKQYDKKKYDHKLYRQMADCFAAASDALEDGNGDLAENAGFVYLVLSDHQAALAANLKAAAIREKVLPPEHPSLATSYNNVGIAYGKLGDHEKALKFELKALAIREKVLPPEHPDLAASYNNVGSTYYQLGDLEKALEFLLKALAIREKVLHPEHPDLAQSYNNVGYTYGELGDHEKALEYKVKALAIKEKVLPPEHPDLAASYNNVGYTYGDLGDHEKALKFKLKALAIREKVLPPEHPDLALSYYNVGFTYGELGDYEKALEFMHKAIAIMERKFPKGHPDLLIYYRNIARIYEEAGDPENAQKYREKANAGKKP